MANSEGQRQAKPQTFKAGAFEISVHSETETHLTISVRRGKAVLSPESPELGQFAVYFTTSDDGGGCVASDLERGLFEQLKNHLERV